MRLSMDPSDSGHHALAPMAKAVMLDGQRVRDVITADEEKGEILHAKRDEKGNLIVNRITEQFETEILTGKVQIVIPSNIREKIEASRK